MDNSQDARYYEKRAEQEISVASSSTDSSVKNLHLNMAARYAALREEAASTMDDPV